jgi:hypothetical protein
MQFVCLVGELQTTGRNWEDNETGRKEGAGDFARVCVCVCGGAGVGGTDLLLTVGVRVGMCNRARSGGER